MDSTHQPGPSAPIPAVDAGRPDEAEADCTQMPASYEFQNDVAIVNRLAVGKGCPVDRPERVWVNGTLRARNGIRTDQTLTALDIGCIVGPHQDTSDARLKADTSTVLGLDGSLRVSDALGIGTTPGDDHSTIASLVVQGSPSDPVLPMQVWRNGGGATRVAVDSIGRVGVGTATPSASLTVAGAFLTQLSGMLEGEAGSTTLSGFETRFKEELVEGATLSVPGLPEPPTTFRVLRIKSDEEIEVDRAPTARRFDQQAAYTDPPLLAVRDGLGTRWLELISSGALTLADGAVSVSGSGSLRLAGDLRVDRTATARDVGFIVGQDRATSAARLKADTSALLAVDGALRVRDGIGIGTPAGTDPSTDGQLVVRGAVAHPARLLQVWQDADGDDQATVSSDGVVTAKQVVGRDAVFADGAASINGDGVVTAKQFVGHGAVITNMIVMWAGAANAIPDGWALCNGDNKTPDLRARFLVGVDESEYQPGDYGDPDSHTHTVSVPANTVDTTTAGVHTHNLPAYWKVATALAQVKKVIDPYPDDVHKQTTQESGNHNHQATITYKAFDSGASSGQNRPKWYALAFIMKLPAA
jgi:hypothetical protein